MTLGGLIAGLILTLIWSRRRVEDLRGKILAKRHCAACGYSLRRLEADQNGRTVCPECGAAWKLAAPNEVSHA
jgi:uncharacterized Zn finger protein (UPF0148 family)